VLGLLELLAFDGYSQKPAHFLNLLRSTAMELSFENFGVMGALELLASNENSEKRAHC